MVAKPLSLSDYASSEKYQGNPELNNNTREFGKGRKRNRFREIERHAFLIAWVNLHGAEMPQEQSPD